MLFGVASRINTEKNTCVKRNWIVSSKYDNHSRKTRILTSMMSKMFMIDMSIENYEKRDYGLDLELLTISY